MATETLRMQIKYRWWFKLYMKALPLICVIRRRLPTDEELNRLFAQGCVFTVKAVPRNE